MAQTLTRAGIITNARHVLNNQETAIWTPVNLNSAFNRFMRRHAREVGALSIVDVQDMVQGQNQYTVPDGAYEIRRVMVSYSLGGPPYELPFYRIDDLPPWWDTLYQAFPIAWTSRGIGSIYLFQIPSANITGGVQIDYFFNPPNLPLDSTGDVTLLEFDSIHEDALTYGYACEMIRLNMEDAALVARLQYLTDEYKYYLADVTDSERSPDNDPIQMGSSRPASRFMNRGLPANWGIRG